jgi:hypothetical protein
VTYRTDQNYDVEDEAYDEDEEEPKRGLLSWILITALLMGSGSGSAVLWRTFGGGPILPSLASVTSPVLTATAEKQAGQGDLDGLRQQITGSVQSTQQLLAAQQAEIKRLSEQVAVLSGKLDLLQRPVTSAQAAIPAPAPKAVMPAPPKKPDVVKPVATKPAEAKPAGAKPAAVNPSPISTGGAPLQLSR